jgi:RNA polymerase sigma-70 factor (ECF subfamily)
MYSPILVIEFTPVQCAFFGSHCDSTQGSSLLAGDNRQDHGTVQTCFGGAPPAGALPPRSTPTLGRESARIRPFSVLGGFPRSSPRPAKAPASPGETEEATMTPLPCPQLAQALTDLIPALMRAALALTRSRDRAEDLAQEALLRVWTRLREGEAIGDLRPYLLTTLRNLARRPPRLAPAEAAAPETAPNAAPDRIACREVIAALSALPPDQGRLLSRVVLDAATIAELAAETGLPPGTVASRLSRARARLRARLDLPDGDPVAAILER